MEVSLSIEKGIGIYLLFVNGLDSFVIFTQIAWPLSCFFILEFITKDIRNLGYYIGIISLVYSLGKLIGYKLISYATETYNIKWVLACLFFVSSLAMISIGLFTNFTGILFSRFLSGFCSNSQQSVRKLLLKISAKQKSDWPGLSQKALWSLKLGGFVGICIGAFLLQTHEYLPGDSKFVQKKFLLCSLIGFLFELSGLFLIFSLESQQLSIPEPKKYVELPEIKEYKDSDHQNNEFQDKEKFEIQSYLQSSVLANEHLPSEESIGPEDIRFYSPRGLANKDFNSRRLNSTRPKGDASFSFNHSNNDLKFAEKHEKPEGEGKRTHISFIEDEFEAIPELQKSEIENQQNDTKIEKYVISHLDFALKYRVLISFVVGMIAESIPYWAYLEISGNNAYGLGLVLILFVLIGGLNLATFSKLLNKFSYYRLYSLALLVLIIVLSIVPVLVFFNVPGVVKVTFLIIVGYSIEILLPVGCIMISDSISLSTRETALENSDFFCIGIKGIGSFLGPALISAMFPFGFWIQTCGLCVLLWYSKRIPVYFSAMATVPYKL